MPKQHHTTPAPGRSHTLPRIPYGLIECTAMQAQYVDRTQLNVGPAPQICMMTALFGKNE